MKQRACHNDTDVPCQDKFSEQWKIFNKIYKAEAMTSLVENVSEHSFLYFKRVCCHSVSVEVRDSTQLSRKYCRGWHGICTCPVLTFLDVRALVDFAFFPLFLFTMDFLPFFSGAGERMVSDLPLAPRFLARSSGWILGRTPPLAIVTPLSNCKEKQCTGKQYYRSSQSAPPKSN